MNLEGLSRERFASFVRAMAHNDKRRRRAWVDDDDLIAAVNGFARCISVTEGLAIQLSHRDYAFALRVYRHHRGLTLRPNAGTVPLLHVA